MSKPSTSTSVRKFLKTVSTEIREEAREPYGMIEYAKRFYKWLDRLTESVQNREIFEVLPKDLSDEKQTSYRY